MMIQALCKVIKQMHYPLEVRLTCVRWYAAYLLSLRHVKEMMTERGVSVDHATVHRWATKILLCLPRCFVGANARWAGVCAWARLTPKLPVNESTCTGPWTVMATRSIACFGQDAFQMLDCLTVDLTCRHRPLDV
ncbi:MAG: IS6 family transposase [Massilia sp.]|nr:IS6 family transposase [Massilia sp.]